MELPQNTDKNYYFGFSPYGQDLRFDEVDQNDPYGQIEPIFMNFLHQNGIQPYAATHCSTSLNRLIREAPNDLCVLGRGKLVGISYVAQIGTQAVDVALKNSRDVCTCLSGLLDTARYGTPPSHNDYPQP